MFMHSKNLKGCDLKRDKLYNGLGRAESGFQAGRRNRPTGSSGWRLQFRSKLFQVRAASPHRVQGEFPRSPLSNELSPPSL